MTAATDRGRDVHAGDDGEIIRIGGVIAGWSMAVFALHARELRRFGQADKTRWQTVTDRVTGQAGAVGLPTGCHELRVGEGAGVRVNTSRIVEPDHGIRCSSGHPYIVVTGLKRGRRHCCKGW